MNTMKTRTAALCTVLATSALVAGASTAPASATGTNNQGVHNLMINDGGADVRTLQYFLVARGYSITVDGKYGPGTRSAVISFQRSKGLSADGVVGSATWGAVRISVSSGSTNTNAVKALQNQLRQKIDSSIAVDGSFGPATRAAVISFQREHGLSQDGAVGPATWSKLLGHFEPPSGSNVCLYGSEPGNAEAWGTSNMIDMLEDAGAAVRGSYGRVAIGDISHTHGGDIAGHASHEVGLDVDLRPMTSGGTQCSTISTYRSSNYSRTATRALVRALRASGRVKLIYFNDPTLINEGLTSYYGGHDDHLHVRISENGVESKYNR